MYDEVNDIEWSPMCSTMFASVGKDGRLELWDLKKNNMLDPFATEGKEEGEIIPSKTMVRFCNSANVVITGDVSGSVNLYRYMGKIDLYKVTKIKAMQKVNKKNYKNYYILQDTQRKRKKKINID